MKILITGGLGYIGSHIASLFGKSAVILDNLSNSKLNYKKILPKCSIHIGEVNLRNLKKIFLKYKISGVIHMAGLKAVNESVRKPLNYYRNNIISSIELLEVMDMYNINKLIFSSSATVYGNNFKSPLGEKLDLQSNNPYGSTKIIIENLINDYCKSNLNFKAISLRYFNPIGADNKLGLKEMPLGQPQNLMPILINAAKNKKILKIYGSNYDTKDGTCIRDFIHVKDLAFAHKIAYEKLHKLTGHEKINLGLGKGISVLELIKIFEKVNQIKLKLKYVKRRRGDSAICYANNSKALNMLDWKPKYTYEDMVKDAWEANAN